MRHGADIGACGCQDWTALHGAWKWESSLSLSCAVQKEMRKSTATANTQNISLPAHDVVIVVVPGAEVSAQRRQQLQNAAR